MPGHPKHPFGRRGQVHAPAAPCPWPPPHASAEALRRSPLSTFQPRIVSSYPSPSAWRLCRLLEAHSPPYTSFSRF
jgi:hypothetical protein